MSDPLAPFLAVLNFILYLFFKTHIRTWFEYKWGSFDKAKSHVIYRIKHMLEDQKDWRRVKERPPVSLDYKVSLSQRTAEKMFLLAKKNTALTENNVRIKLRSYFWLELNSDGLKVGSQ